MKTTLDMTMREILDQMEQVGAGSMSFTMSDSKKALVAVMLVIGDDAQPCLDAVNKITDHDED